MLRINNNSLIAEENPSEIVILGKIITIKETYNRENDNQLYVYQDSADRVIIDEMNNDQSCEKLIRNFNNLDNFVGSDVAKRITS